MNKNIKNALIYLLVLIIVTSIGVVLVSVLFGVMPIIGDSMHPTIESGDNVFLLKVGKFEKGDIVVFVNNDTRLIKRIIALAGDTVESRIVDNEIKYFVNGEMLDDEGYINGGKNFHTQQKVIVPEGCFYYLGDNRAISLDSHSFSANDTVFGNINSIEGKVLFRYNFKGKVFVEGI